LRTNFAAVGLVSAMALIAAPLQAASIGVQPLMVEVEPGQSTAIRVRNASDESTSIETVVVERKIDENGVQSQVPADDAFILLPPQGTIAPQGLQVIRVQPLGATGLKESKSYFVSVQQVPVAFKPTERTGAGAHMLVRFAFDVAVHVVPRGAKPKMELVSASPGTMMITIPPRPEEVIRPGGPPKPVIKTMPAAVISVRNDGNRYLYLQAYDYTITAVLEDGSRKEFPKLTEREIVDAAGVTLVPPHSARKFSLPLLEGTRVRSLSVQVRERPEG